MLGFLGNKTKIVGLCLFFVLSLSLNTVPVFAENTISLSISSNALSLDLIPTTSTGDFAKSNDLNISVVLTGEGGYTLGIRSGTTGTNVTNLVNTTDNTKVFSSISSAVSENNFTSVSNTQYNNQWGYLPSKYDSSANTNFLPAPDANGDTLDYNEIDNATGNYTLAIGARADLETAVGSYTNTFIITAIANISCNPSATTIGEALCMQDMNDSVINSMEEHRQYQLKDSRDWKKYYIAKMNDGRVWMTQNLDLDLETTPTNVAELTSKNTDLNIFGSQNYTTDNGYSCSNPSTTTNCTASGEIITYTPSVATVTTASDYGSNNSYFPASFDYGENYQYVNSSGTTTNYSSTNACLNAHNDGTCPHYHVGNYYNFTTAVASNSTSGITTNYTTFGNSICPAGWRLPIGRSSTEYAEANYTWRSEGLVADYVFNGIANYLPDDTNGWNHIRSNPMYMVAAGYKNGNSAPSSLGSYGEYRTSTIYSSSSAYDYYFRNNDNISPSYTTMRGYGESVRCVARQNNTGSTLITFDKNANDATGVMNNQTYNAGTLNTLPLNGFNRSGYMFNSWNTKADGSGVSYANEGQYYAAVGTSNKNVTLYAQWDKTYIITFNLGSNVTSISFGGTIYTNGQTTQAIENKTYVIGGNFAPRYGFNNWSVTAGDLENNTYAATYYTVTGNATITLTSKLATIDMTTMTNPTTPVSDTCNSDPVSPELVYDPRDNEAYFVARMCDGKYWMLDNLRLDLSNSTTLNSLSTSNTNITAQALSCLKTGIYNGDTCAIPYVSTPISNETSYFYSATKAQINVDYKNNIASVVHGPGSGKVGVYYNYCSLSGGSYCYASGSGVDVADTNRDIESDLCPAGWHVFTAASDYVGEFPELRRLYNSKEIFGEKLSIPYVGHYKTIQYDYGDEGAFWSSTYQSTWYMWVGMNSGKVSNTIHNRSRDEGYPMRCVLGSS